MKLVFVHGLGGEDGGPLERNLFEYADRESCELLTIRWAAGNFKKIAGGDLWDLAQEAVTEHHPWRFAIRVIVRVQQEAHQHWDSALGNATRATQKLVGVIKFLAGSGEEFSVVGFSLGGRVLMSALQVIGDPGAQMRRAVFAAAAVSSSNFARLQPALLSGGRIVNVYSDDDEVLASLYPIVHGLDGAAGTGPVLVSGGENVKVAAGHLSYAKLGRKFVALATAPAQQRSLLPAI